MKGSIFGFYALLVFIRSGASELTAILNPGCTICDISKQSVIEIIQRENNISTHFIISACELPFSLPSGIISQSNCNRSTTYNWTKIVNKSDIKNSITLVNSSFCGIAFPYLYPYHDERNSANISEASDTKKWLLSKCFWKLSDWDSVPNNETGFLNVIFKCDDTRDKFFVPKGFLELMFTMSERTQRSSRAPHLLIYGGLSIHVRVTLKNLFSPWKKPTRFALPLTMIVNRNLLQDENFSTNQAIDIDDELSPGVFKEFTVYLGRTSGEYSSNRVSTPAAFLYWKLVSYVDKTAAELKYSRRIGVSKQGSDVTLKHLSNSLIYAVVPGSKKNKQLPLFPTIRTVNISFGEPGDGFFAATHYMDWSFLMSLGDPPESNSYSTLITCLLVLGASFLVISGFGLLFITTQNCLRWRRQRCSFDHFPIINAVSEAEIMKI